MIKPYTLLSATARWLHTETCQWLVAFTGHVEGMKVRRQARKHVGGRDSGGGQTGREEGGRGEEERRWRGRRRGEEEGRRERERKRRRDGERESEGGRGRRREGGRGTSS